MEEARPTQTLRLVFSSLPVSEIPEVGDGVTLVSADALADERAGMHNFIDEIALDAQMPEQLDDVVAALGMPIHVFIRTADRTQFFYLLKPLEDFSAIRIRKLVNSRKPLTRERAIIPFFASGHLIDEARPI